MSNAQLLNIDQEKAKEIPMVDLAFLILKAANVPYYYRDLMKEISKLQGIPEDNVIDVIAQLYTEINIDGRFACVGNNLWGLKRWYPLDKAEDGPGNTSRPRIINDEDDDDLYNDDEEEVEEVESEDEEDFDADFDEEEADADEDEIDEELDDDADDEEVDELEDLDIVEDEEEEPSDFDEEDEDDLDK